MKMYHGKIIYTTEENQLDNNNAQTFEKDYVFGKMWETDEEETLLAYIRHNLMLNVNIEFNDEHNVMFVIERITEN